MFQTSVSIPPPLPCHRLGRLEAYEYGFVWPETGQGFGGKEGPKGKGAKSNFRSAGDTLAAVLPAL